MLSLVLPAYNEEENIRYAYEKISYILQKNQIPFEFIFINDGSSDGTWNEIETIARKDMRVHGIKFSRNFGKEAAIMAGLKAVSGDCCVVMDCDLQHPPETIISMYKYWEQGAEIVEGVKEDRGKEKIFYAIAAKIFNTLISRLTNVKLQNASDFKLMDKKVVRKICQFPEKEMFFRAISTWVGYKTIQVEFKVQERKIGVSKWSLKSLVKYAITNITSFSSFPIYLVLILGIVYLGISFAMCGVILKCFIVNLLVNKDNLIICLMFMIGGTVLVGIGIIGYYIAKILRQVQNRPRYIISEKI